jgi:hypothetical protein
MMGDNSLYSPGLCSGVATDLSILPQLEESNTSASLLVKLLWQIEDDVICILQTQLMKASY